MLARLRAARGFAVDEALAAKRALLDEGPTWSPRDSALYWVDILTPAVLCYHSHTGTYTEV